MEFIDSGLELDEKNPTIKFRVEEQDVMAAWSIVKLSMHAYKCFKVASFFHFFYTNLYFFKTSIFVELEGEVDMENVEKKLLTDEEITEDILLGPGCKKIRLLYNQVDENNEVLILNWFII